MIRWSTLVADDQGVIDYSRVKSLIAVLLALCAGAVTTAVVVVELVSPTKTVDATIFGIMVTALVLPLTGGKIADAIKSKVAA